MARHFQPKDSPFSENISPEAAAREITRFGASAVTISGGEPFEQAEDLKRLLELLKGAGISDIIVYSGATYEDLCRKFAWLPHLIACLVDGPFKKDLPAEECWRGSANQCATIFRNRPFYENWLRTPKGSLQLAHGGNNLYMIGIPRIGDAAKLLGTDNGSD